MPVLEVQLAGLGGQGVILAGMTIGRGLALYENYHVSLTQSFGPEARGSACSVQLVVSPELIHYPYVERPNILAVLSQEAYLRFAPHLREQGIILLEEDLVQPNNLRPDVRVWRVPATRLAEELGRRIVLNMVLVGFFTAITGLLRVESARRAVSESVPPGNGSLEPGRLRQRVRLRAGASGGGAAAGFESCSLGKAKEKTMATCAQCGRESAVTRKSLYFNHRLCPDCSQAERKRPIYTRPEGATRRDPTVIGLAGSGKDGINLQR